MSMFWASCQNHGTAPVVISDILRVSNPNLKVFYTFDNITGTTVNDESPAGNNAVISGATPIPGKFDNGYLGDGVDDNIEITNNSLFNTSTGSISCWFSGSYIGAVWTITNDSATTPYAFSGQLLQGGFVRYIMTISGSIARNFQSLQAANTDTAFHNVIWSSDGGTVRLYVDGAEWVVTERSGQSNNGLWFDNTFNANAGINRSRFLSFDRSSPSPQNIDIDHFRYFDRAITQSEALDLFNDPGGVYP